jgi:hypothetical protein
MATRKYTVTSRKTKEWLATVDAKNVPQATEFAYRTLRTDPFRTYDKADFVVRRKR